MGNHGKTRREGAVGAGEAAGRPRGVCAGDDGTAVVAIVRCACCRAGSCTRVLACKQREFE